MGFMSTDSPPFAETHRAFEWFELTIALLLGCGAVGASVAGYQSGLWNGKSAESFAKASSMTTLAAADEHKAVMVSLHDEEIDLEAKKLLVEAETESDEHKRQTFLRVASGLYLHHLSKAAYKDLGLPTVAPQSVLSAEALAKAGKTDLSDTYMHRVFSAAEADRKKADEDFAIGSHASTAGDHFALAEVLFAVSLFISGTAMVFKTRLKWWFASMGLVALLTAFGYLASLDWM